jgi:hypothetical protein
MAGSLSSTSRVRSSPLEPELEDDAALHDRGVAEVPEHSGEEAIENEDLPEARHAAPARGGAHALLERLAERFRGCVASRLHLVLDGPDGGQRSLDAE